MRGENQDIYKTVDLKYRKESNIDVQEFMEVLQKSTLGERRLIYDVERLTLMLSNANLIVTARKGNELIGIARALSDFTYCTYLSDLAVKENYQRQGIGRQLIKKVKEFSPLTTLIVLSAPCALEFYSAIGMEKHEGAYILKSDQSLKN